MGRFRPYSREMTSLLHSSPRLPPNHLTKVTQWECHKKALDSLVLNSKLYQWPSSCCMTGRKTERNTVPANRRGHWAMLERE